MSNKIWNESELDYMRKNYGRVPVEDMAKVLNRTTSTIYTRANMLGLQDKKNWWKQCEIDFLIENAEHMTDYEIGKYLNRSTKSVAQKRVSLNIRPKQYLTDYQKEFIRSNYYNMSVDEIANILQVKGSSITYFIRSEHIVKQKHTEWSECDKAYLMEHYLTDMTAQEIALKLGKTIHSIHSYAGKLGVTQHTKFTNEEIIYIKEHFETMKYEDIAAHIGRTEASVRAFIFDNKWIKSEQQTWSLSEDEFLITYYNDMSLRELSTSLNKTKNAVRLHARKLGLLHKGANNCNSNFFNVIDNEEKAYWLGFILADGCVTGQDVVSISLQVGDKEHLHKFNKSIEGNYKVYTTTNKADKLIKKDVRACGITVHCKKIHDDLKNILGDNKTYECRMPIVRDDLLRHLYRGYFDGDGRLCFTDKSFHVNFVTASKTLNDDIVSQLNDFGIKQLNKNTINQFGTIIYEPFISKIADMLKFLHWLYDDSTIYLDRKYQKVQKIFHVKEAGLRSDS